MPLLKAAEAVGRPKAKAGREHEYMLGFFRQCENVDYGAYIDRMNVVLLCNLTEPCHCRNTVQFGALFFFL